MAMEPGALKAGCVPASRAFASARVSQATETGRYQMAVLMSACSSRCNYGVKVYEAK